MNKKLFASLLLGFGGTLAVLVAVAMPPGSWAVVVGVFLGLLGCIPVMMVVMYANRHRREEVGQPPVYIVQQPQPVYGYYEQPQPQYFQPQPPQNYAPQFEEYYEEYVPMMPPPAQAPRQRRQPRRQNNSLLMPTRKPLPSARRRAQPQYEQPQQQYYEPQYYAEPEYYEPQLEYPAQAYYDEPPAEQDYYAPPRRNSRPSQTPRREQGNRYGYTDAVDADFRTIGE